MQSFRDWLHKHFSDPQVVILIGMLLAGALGIILLGRLLAPVFASMVIAYLLEGPVSFLEKYRFPRILAVLLVFLVFLSFLMFLLLGLYPLLWQQVEQLVQQLPSMLAWGHKQLLQLPKSYPEFISEQQVNDLIRALGFELTSLGQQVLSLSIASVRGIISALIYVILLPFLVFFLLKDKKRILRWVESFLPQHRTLACVVWLEVDRQTGNYIRGKVWQILILWAASYITFTILGLQFSMLLGFFNGLSVLVPYIGATVMAFPYMSIGYFQWGWSPEFWYVVTAYIILQTLDGNVLHPLLFSEIVSLHPVAIIVSILFFGGIWGFWGLFFAIPLATLVQAVLNAWPKIGGPELPVKCSSSLSRTV